MINEQIKLNVCAALHPIQHAHAPKVQIIALHSKVMPTAGTPPSSTQPASRSTTNYVYPRSDRSDTMNCRSTLYAIHTHTSARTCDGRLMAPSGRPAASSPRSPLQPRSSLLRYALSPPEHTNEHPKPKLSALPSIQPLPNSASSQAGRLASSPSSPTSNAAGNRTGFGGGGGGCAVTSGNSRSSRVCVR